MPPWMEHLTCRPTVPPPCCMAGMLCLCQHCCALPAALDAAHSSLPTPTACMLSAGFISGDMGRAPGQALQQWPPGGPVHRQGSPAGPVLQQPARRVPASRQQSLAGPLLQQQASGLPAGGQQNVAAQQGPWAEEAPAGLQQARAVANPSLQPTPAAPDAAGAGRAPQTAELHLQLGGSPEGMSLDPGSASQQDPAGSAHGSPLVGQHDARGPGRAASLAAEPPLAVSAAGPSLQLSMGAVARAASLAGEPSLAAYAAEPNRQPGLQVPQRQAAALQLQIAPGEAEAAHAQQHDSADYPVQDSAALAPKQSLRGGYEFHQPPEQPVRVPTQVGDLMPRHASAAASVLGRMYTMQPARRSAAGPTRHLSLSPAAFARQQGRAVSQPAMRRQLDFTAPQAASADSAALRDTAAAGQASAPGQAAAVLLSQQGGVRGPATPSRLQSLALELRRHASSAEQEPNSASHAIRPTSRTAPLAPGQGQSPLWDSAQYARSGRHHHHKVSSSALLLHSGHHIASTEVQCNM